jgi:hypothetical protein
MMTIRRCCGFPCTAVTMLLLALILPIVTGRVQEVTTNTERTNTNNVYDVTVSETMESTLSSSSSSSSSYQLQHNDDPIQQKIVQQLPVVVESNGVVVDASSTTSATVTTSTMSESQAQNERIYYLRQRRQQKHQQSAKWENGRMLPGNDYNMDNIDMSSAEAGFIVGIIFLVLLFLFVCCCCCNLIMGGGRRYNNGGGGRGSSCLWDLVAIVCLWELCCDNDGMMGDGFMRF